MIQLLNNALQQHGIHANLAHILSALIFILFIILVSWLANYVANHYIVKLVRYMMAKMQPRWALHLSRHKVLTRLSHIAPALIIYYTLPPVFTTELSSVALAEISRLASTIYIIVVITLSISSFLSTFAGVYQHYKMAKQRPIKSYIQVIRISLFCIAGILALSAALGKSPIALLTGLGAMTAILLLVFKDSILGFVSSILIATNDMVRIGDWIELPKYGVNGDIIDLSLNTIKVQNFDKTIITLPTYAIMNEGVKNWRGMTESGGRRIKRSINLDINTIRFCDAAMLTHLRHIQYMDAYIAQRQQDIDLYNENMNIDKKVILGNGRNLTNVGLFRAYVDAYLKHHPQISRRLTFLVRQLQPTETGLPLELYIFTNDTDWGNYENIQADIFDHLLAMLPEFGLRIFQNINDRKVHIALDKTT